AQYTGSYQTNIFKGQLGLVGDYVVGSNWMHDALIIQNGGALSNGNGYVGYEIGANYNAAIISGSGSAWSNSADLFVGYSGMVNQLIITNGGLVYNLNGRIGYNSSSSNNS